MVAFSFLRLLNYIGENFRGINEASILTPSSKLSSCQKFWQINEWEIAIQLRRRDFFCLGGGRPGHLKATTPPPHRRGSGGEGPTDGVEVSLKRSKLLENVNSIFQEYQRFFIAKNQFFKENFRKLNIFHENSEFSRKTI